MNVWGIDTSLTGTGISDGKNTWIVKSTGKKDDGLLQRSDRLTDLVTRIWAHLPTDHRDPPNTLVLIEAPAFSRAMGHMHDRSGLWWLLVDGLMGAGYRVVEVAPTSLKLYAAGKGNAGKPQMLEAAIRRLPDVETGSDDNRVDALWLAAMGHDHLRQPLCELPAAHRVAMTKVRWPA